MEVIHQQGRTFGLADYLFRFNEKEWSKNAMKLWENWFVVNSVEETKKIHYRQLYANLRMNKFFNQPIEIEQSANVRAESENAANTNYISKHSKMSRLQVSREKNAVRNLIKASKNIPIKQIVQSLNLKTSPIQSVLLMANYQSDSGLQNVREAVLRRDLNFLRRENKSLSQYSMI